MPGAKMNALAAIYVVSRIIFTVTYVMVSSRPLSLLRSISFMFQMIVYITVFITSAGLVAASS